MLQTGTVSTVVRLALVACTAEQHVAALMRTAWNKQFAAYPCHESHALPTKRLTAMKLKESSENSLYSTVNFVYKPGPSSTYDRKIMRPSPPMTPYKMPRAKARNTRKKNTVSKRSCFTLRAQHNAGKSEKNNFPKALVCMRSPGLWRRR